MIVMKKALPRRTFLRGIGATVARADGTIAESSAASQLDTVVTCAERRSTLLSTGRLALTFFARRKSVPWMVVTTGVDVSDARVIATTPLGNHQ